MKYLFLILGYLFIAVGNTSCSSNKNTPVKEIETASSESVPFGVNLAGAEFSEKVMPGELGRHYFYPTEVQLDYFKSKGLMLIRFPFRWERIQHSLGGELDKVELQRMKDFVSEAKKRGMYILLDMHNYGRRVTPEGEFIIGSPQISIADVSDVWNKIASEFKEFDNIWGYGLMNEPYKMLSSPSWFDIAQEIIYSIRKTDNSTPIVVGGNTWSSSQIWVQESDTLKHLIDPANNLIYEAHVYFDVDRSGTYAQGYIEEGGTPMRGAERVYPFLRWLAENNKRGFVGEYGIPSNDPRWLKTLDNLLVLMTEYGVNGTYWAAGPSWGSYPLSVEPSSNGIDKPQMSVLSKHLSFDKNLKLNKVLLSRNSDAVISASSFTYPPESPEKANDRNYSTRWNSDESGDKWIAYDLGKSYDISRIVLQWESWDITKSFIIQTSLDGKNWENKLIENNNTEPLRIFNLEFKNTRFVRLYVNASDDDIVRLLEFEVWGNK